MKTSAAVFLIAIFSAVLGLSVVGSAKAEDTAQPAPTWKLKDLDGRDVSSADFKGKVLVVDFWATWCPPCREEIPGYVQLQDKYRDKGLVIIGVSMDQAGPEVVRKFAAAQKINYPLVMGTDEVVAAFGGFEAIPTTFVIDREGRIRHHKMGAVPTDEFEKVIKPLL